MSDMYPDIKNSNQMQSWMTYDQAFDANIAAHQQVLTVNAVRIVHNEGANSHIRRSDSEQLRSLLRASGYDPKAAATLRWNSAPLLIITINVSGLPKEASRGARRNQFDMADKIEAVREIMDNIAAWAGRPVDIAFMVETLLTKGQGMTMHGYHAEHAYRTDGAKITGTDQSKPGGGVTALIREAHHHNQTVVRVNSHANALRNAARQLQSVLWLQVAQEGGGYIYTGGAHLTGDKYLRPRGSSQKDGAAQLASHVAHYAGKGRVMLLGDLNLTPGTKLIEVIRRAGKMDYLSPLLPTHWAYGAARDGAIDRIGLGMGPGAGTTIDYVLGSYNPEDICSGVYHEHIGKLNFDHAAVWAWVPGCAGKKKHGLHSNEREPKRQRKLQVHKLHENPRLAETYAATVDRMMGAQPRPPELEAAVGWLTNILVQAATAAGVPWSQPSGYNSNDGLASKYLTAADIGVINQKRRHWKKYSDANKAKDWNAAKAQWGMWKKAARSVAGIAVRCKGQKERDRLQRVRNAAGTPAMWEASKEKLGSNGRATQAAVRLRVESSSGSGERTTNTGKEAAEEFTKQWCKVKSRDDNRGPHADKWRAELASIVSEVAAQRRGEKPLEGGELNHKFTGKELDAVVAKVRTHGAHDVDNVSYDLVKMLSADARAEIGEIASQSLKEGAIAQRWRESLSMVKHKDGRDPTVWGSYRVLCITSIILKLIESMIDARISAKHARELFIAMNQFGFQKGVSIFDCLYAAMAATGDGDKRGPRSNSPGDRFSFYLDLLQAFPRAFMPAVLVELYRSGVKGLVWWWMYNLYSEQYNTITVGGEQGPRYRVLGLREGSPCSPRLFMIMINRVFEIMRGKGISVGQNLDIWVGLLGFADDLSGHADSDDEVQDMLDMLDEFAEEYLLQFTGPKCGVTASLENAAVQRQARTYKFRCAGGVTEIHEKPKAKQLGLWHGADRSPKVHASSRSQVAPAASAVLAAAGAGTFGAGGAAEKHLVGAIWDSTVYFATEQYPAEIANGDKGAYKKIMQAAAAGGQALHGGARGPAVAAEMVTGMGNPLHAMEYRSAKEIGRKLARPAHTLTHRLQREEAAGHVYGEQHRAATAAIAQRAGLGCHYRDGTSPGCASTRNRVVREHLGPLHGEEQRTRMRALPSLAFQMEVHAWMEGHDIPLPEHRDYADNGYPAWRIIMAGGDRLREFPRSAARAAQDRACQNAGCMGVTETKAHLLGSCRKERIAEIRRQFAAEQRIGTYGGAFTHQQVVRIMANDSADWGATLDREGTEAAVQRYVGQVWRERFGQDNGSQLLGRQ